MSTENQNLAGKLAALAQKTGSKPFVKIIGGVCAAILALVALCSVLGDSDSAAIEMVKNSVWEYDDTVTFEEALSAYCERESRKKRDSSVRHECGKGKANFYCEDAEEFEKFLSSLKGRNYAWRSPIKELELKGFTFLPERLNEFGSLLVTEKGVDAYNAKLVPVWEDGGVSSTGVQKVKVRLVWKGDCWMPANKDKILDGEALAKKTFEDGSSGGYGYYRVKYELKEFTLNFRIYPDGSISAENTNGMKYYIYAGR